MLSNRIGGAPSPKPVSFSGKYEWEPRNKEALRAKQLRDFTFKPKESFGINDRFEDMYEQSQAKRRNEYLRRNSIDLQKELTENPTGGDWLNLTEAGKVKCQKHRANEVALKTLMAAAELNNDLIPKADAINAETISKKTKDEKEKGDTWADVLDHAIWRQGRCDSTIGQYDGL